VLVARVGKCVIVAATLSVFGGCQAVGPIAIDAGRDRYNSIIQSTSKHQAFANIIRVRNNEPTAFMDVTEVDATQTLTGTLSGSVTGIGARAGTSGGTLAGQVGSITPGVTYSETPLIRYVPLVGQGFVQQTVAPVNTDALASLYDSAWAIMPLLDLSMPFLTLEHDKVGAALNLIAELDYDERLRMTSTKSDWTKKPNASGDGSGKGGAANNGQSDKKSPTSTSTDDTLIIYFVIHPHAHAYALSTGDKKDSDLWARLLRLYQGTQLTACPPPPKKQPKNCMPASAPSIELRSMPVTKTPNPFIYTAPLMRTYSGLGILKSAAQPPNPRIGFVSRSDYNRITQYWWNDPDHKDSSLCVYTLAPGPHDLQPGDEALSHVTPGNNQGEDAEREDPKIKEWLAYNERRVLGDSHLSLPYVYWEPGMSDDVLVNVNYRLWQLRRYMLIIHSDGPPPADAYVAYFDHGQWYYIAGEDVISQRNFNLIALFLTVMAYPPTNPPLTTSISIGGGG